MVQLQICRYSFCLKNAFVERYFDYELAVARLTIACCHQSGLAIILQECANRYDLDFELALFYLTTSQLLQFIAALGLFSLLDYSGWYSSLFCIAVTVTDVEKVRHYYLWNVLPNLALWRPKSTRDLDSLESLDDLEAFGLASFNWTLGLSWSFLGTCILIYYNFTSIF